MDLRNVDVSKDVINIVNNWDFYPGALYTSEDFAYGETNNKADPDVSASDFAYGTYRLRILAQPNQYYTICSFSLDYASRVYVNGTRVAAFGNVADNADDFVPRVGYMTIPMNSGDAGEIEVIYQYGNYVHREGGFIQPTYLSAPQRMEEFKNYAPDQYQVLEKAAILREGNYVVLLASQDIETLKAAFDKAAGME